MTISWVKEKLNSYSSVSCYDDDHTHHYDDDDHTQHYDDVDTQHYDDVDTHHYDDDDTHRYDAKLLLRLKINRHSTQPYLVLWT